MKFKKCILLSGICMCVLFSSAQWNHGNEQFRLSVKILETYLAKPYSVEAFEKTLTQYQRKDFIGDTSRYPDGRISINTTYKNMTAKQWEKGGFDEVFLTYDGNGNKITSLRFKLEEDDLNTHKLQNLFKQITAAGYKYDLRNTRLQAAFAGSTRKQYYYNASKKVRISIYFIEENRYAVEFSK